MTHFTYVPFSPKYKKSDAVLILLCVFLCTLFFCDKKSKYKQHANIKIDLFLQNENS